MKLMVCGSRSWRRPVDVEIASAIQSFENELDGCVEEILHGGAAGVDTQAGAFAREAGLKETVHRPNYEENPPLLAPKLRNAQMVREADAVLAIWDGFSGGTAHAIATAARLGKPLRIVDTADLGDEP